MSITGNLKTMELSELLQWLSQGRKTGTLYIDNGTVEKRIFFRDGTIISAAASDPKEYLGHFLVSHGYIDELMLAKAMEMQESNRMLLGKILVTIGAISEADLEHMLRLKAEEGIYEIFTWREGDFQFIDDELPGYTMVPISIDVTALVLEGLHRLDEWTLIREHIPSMQTVPVAVGELEAPADNPGAARILALVDDDTTVQEIALQTHSSEFFVCRVLFDQIRAGRLKVVRPRRGGEVSGHAAEVEPDALIQAARHHLEAREFEASLRHLRAARSLEPNSSAVGEAVDRIEGRIREQLAEAGLDLSAVPRLSRPLDDLATADITPQEGFILTRVNGTYDLRTLIKISPIPPLEAQVVFWKLKQSGYITLAPAED